MVRDRKNESKEVLLASDHAGFKLKQAIKNFLFKRGIIVRDLGTKNTSSVDYPVYAHILSKKINKNKNQFGILVCGSGVGMSITANKYKNVAPIVVAKSSIVITHHLQKTKPAKNNKGIAKPKSKVQIMQNTKKITVKNKKFSVLYFIITPLFIFINS